MYRRKDLSCRIACLMKTSYEEECYHQTLFGGDQLTACRCRGAQSARINDDDTAERLIGLVPVVEDWHA